MITLHSFNIELMAWNLVPTTVEFVVSEEPIGVGAFCENRKATTTHPLFAYVVFARVQVMTPPERCKIR